MIIKIREKKDGEVDELRYARNTIREQDAWRAEYLNEARYWANMFVELHNGLKEYVEVMATEPDEFILLSKVYHDLKRILGDEE